MEIINDEMMDLGPDEMRAWGIKRAPIALAEVAFGGKHCPVARMSVLRAKVEAAKDRRGSRWMYTMAGMQEPTDELVDCLELDMDVVARIAGRAFVYTLEVELGRPHETVDGSEPL